MSPKVWHTISGSDKTDQLSDIMIYDIDHKRFVHELNLPELPEPAATLLIDALNSLLSAKEQFTNMPNAPVEKIVLFLLCVVFNNDIIVAYHIVAY